MKTYDVIGKVELKNNNVHQLFIVFSFLCLTPKKEIKINPICHFFVQHIVVFLVICLG